MDFLGVLTLQCGHGGETDNSASATLLDQLRACVFQNKKEAPRPGSHGLVKVFGGH